MSAPLSLRDYQQRALDGLYGYFERHSGHPLAVLPTAAGKSLVIGALCRDILTQWPDQRIMILSHVKELLEQNFSKILGFWPQAPAGLYCAGLGKKQARDSITVASIQSVFRKPHVFGWRDLILIDECHLLSPESDSMYRRFIDGLRQTNPLVRVIGFTATAYRMKTGQLHEGRHRLFTDIAVEVSLQELLDGGYIAPLVSKASVVQADLTGVALVAGEFNARQAEAAMDKERLTAAALDEVFALASDRKSWLVFCSGVKHAEHVRDAIQARGVPAASVTGETPAVERDAILKAFKAGTLRAVTSVGVLTTGFDAPNIDLIVMLRPTMSPGLWVQMLGRGLRTAPGKKNCLCLDYTDNTARLGPINAVRPPRGSSGRGEKGERHQPTCLICPKCRMASPLGSLECGECGHTFERPELVKHDTRASTLEVMQVQTGGAGPGAGAEWLDVDSVRYARHEKEGKIPSMRVEYQCGMRRVSEWVCLDHPPGYARAKAIQWWRQRGGDPIPESIDAAVALSAGLRSPRRIRVRQNGKWLEVIAHDFEGQDNEDRPVEAAEPAGVAA